MTERSAAALTVYGLAVDNSEVDADVFSKILASFLEGLAAADVYANGRESHGFLIVDLARGSAKLKICEIQKTRTAPAESSVAVYRRAIEQIRNNDRTVQDLPKKLVKSIKNLGVGVNKKFAYAEIGFDDGNVIRVDDDLLKQAIQALDIIDSARREKTPPFFRGVAIGSFDGVLQVIDARGDVLRAKLVTSAGGVEIECDLNRELISKLITLFDKRVRIEGTAIYDGFKQVPIRVEVTGVKLLDSSTSLLHWGGLMRPAEISDDW